MLNLVLTTDKLQLVTSSAATVDVHASFADLSGTTVTPGKQNTAISSATTTDIVASPAGSTYRNVKTLHIRNKDASLSCDVTVVFDANGTDYELHKATLATGQSLEYIEGIGFFLIQATAKLDTVLYVTANSLHAVAATPNTITGLSLSVLSGHIYTFNCGLFHFANASTNGPRFSIGGVAMTFMVAGEIGVVTNSVTAAALGTGVATAVDTAAVAMTTGQTANGPTWFAGAFQPSADGTFSIKGAPEVDNAAGLTVMKGSWAHIRETDN